MKRSEDEIRQLRMVISGERRSPLSRENKLGSFYDVPFFLEHVFARFGNRFICR